MTWRIVHGDCIEVMASLPAASVDAIVTDPPYGLGFMGRAWDDLPPGLLWAQECLRVLKPGGHLLAFGGTRTYHRLTCAIEDAGFEVRDCIAWMYGSGFPKSLNVSAAIDKAAGVEREVLGERTYADGHVQRSNGTDLGRMNDDAWQPTDGRTHTAPATPDAVRWDGWGTALKPAFEPIVVARKPLAGTVAGNVLEWGTGALNVDGCRVGRDEGDRTDYGLENGAAAGIGYHGLEGRTPYDGSAGRWPANVVLDSEAAAVLDEQTGELSTHAGKRHGGATSIYGSGIDSTMAEMADGDTGGASRFFATFSACGNESIEAGNTSAGKNTASSADSSPTAGFGSKSTDPSQPDTKSTTATKTPSTTTSATLNCSNPGDISATTGRSEPRLWSATESAAAPAVASGERSEISLSEPQAPDSPTAATAATPTFESGEQLTAPSTPPTCVPIEQPANPDRLRFFYVAKADSQERNAGLAITTLFTPADAPTRNDHPTVKPIALMRWLVRLVTPPDGLVVDPFAGSGTTGCAAVLEGFNFVGIEREEASVEIARARIAHWSNGTTEDAA